MGSFKVQYTNILKAYKALFNIQINKLNNMYHSSAVSESQTMRIIYIHLSTISQNTNDLPRSVKIIKEVETVRKKKVQSSMRSTSIRQLRGKNDCSSKCLIHDKTFSFFSPDLLLAPLPRTFCKFSKLIIQEDILETNS